MTLNDWSDIAQVIGNFAVLVTLVVLVMQIRANTRTLLRQMHADRASALYEDIFTSPALLSAHIKMLDSAPASVLDALVARHDGLTRDEALVVTRYCLKMFMMYEGEFLFGGPSESLSRSIGVFMRSGDYRVAWDEFKRIRDPAFVQYVDSLPARTGSPPP